MLEKQIQLQFYFNSGGVDVHPDGVLLVVLN